MSQEKAPARRGGESILARLHRECVGGTEIKQLGSRGPHELRKVGKEKRTRGGGQRFSIKKGRNRTGKS